MEFNGEIEYLEKTAFSYTLIGTGLKSSRVFPSSISRVISVLLLLVFSLSSFWQMNRTVIYFSWLGSSSPSGGSTTKQSLKSFFFIEKLNFTLYRPMFLRDICCSFNSPTFKAPKSRRLSWVEVEYLMSTEMLKASASI
jgi:hypothetical protein